MSAYIHSIGLALPANLMSQTQIADFMVNYLKLNKEEEKRLRILYRATGINQRYSVLRDFAENLNGEGFFKEKNTFPPAKPRMLLYQHHAINLALKACQKAISGSSVKQENITHLITVSCTGMYAPGLDIELINKLNLPTHTERTSINFMGCYAAFNAMKVAKNIIKADDDALVIIVCVEICSIHLQNKTDDESLLSNAIFGDGAAATLISSKISPRALEIKSFYSDIALHSKDKMGWYIGNHGFEMKLSNEVPNIIKKEIGKLTNRLMEKMEMTIDNIDYFAIHPGGKKILDVIENKLNISKDQNKPAREVLKIHGNMSSPTILFVIKNIFDSMIIKDDQKHLLSFAFGPGLTMESAVLKSHINA